MADEGQSIGAARIDIVINLDDYKAEIDRAKNLAAGLGTDFEASFAKMTGSSKRATSEALKLSQTWGKNADEIKLLTLAARGAAPEALEALRQKMAAVRNEAGKGGSQLNAYGQTAKQTAAALRGVPAQLTDIVVGLSSGQRPLTVLLQQGGQLKDIFGGVAPAARALGGALLGLINPYTLTAAAVASVGLAYFQAEKEQEGFRKAILFSGNAAGTSVDQLEALAESVGKVVGTQHQAADVLAQLAASGKVAGNQLQSAAVAAITFEKTAGVSAAETIKNLISLGEKPADASKKLDAQLHYLTASVYQQIRALEDQGKTTQAAALAQSEYERAIAKTGAEASKQMGALTELAVGTKQAFADMWGVFLEPFRDNTLQKELDKVNDELARPRGGGRFQITDSRANELEAKRNSLMEVIRLEKLFGQQDADAEDARKKALAEADIQYAQSERDREALSKYFSDRRKAQLGIDITSIQTAAAAQVDAVSNAQNLLEARYAAGLVSEKDYYDQRRLLIGQTASIQQGELQAENRRLAQESTRLLDEAEKAKALADSLEGSGSKDYARDLADASQKQDDARRAKLQNDAQIKANSAEIAKLTRDEASQTLILSVQEKARGDALVRSYEQAKAAADNYLATLSKQYALEEKDQFAGNKTRQQDSGRSAIEDKYAQQSQQVEIDRSNNPTVDPKVYDQRLALIKDSLGKELALYDDHWNKLTAAQGDWLNGAHEAFRNYADDAANTAKQTETVFTDAFQGLEDVLTDGLSGSGFKFSKFIDSVEQDILRLLVVKPLIAALSRDLGQLGSATANSNWFQKAESYGASLFGGGSGNNFGPHPAGRASGGSVDSGRLYRVNENGVEALRIPGRADYLMTGNKGGQVIPNSQITGRSVSVTQQNIYNGPPPDIRTQRQRDVESSRRLRIATARFA